MYTFILRQPACYESLTVPCKHLLPSHSSASCHFRRGATGKRVANCRTIIKAAMPFHFLRYQPDARPSFPAALCARLMAIYRNHPPQESPFTRPCKLFDIAIRRVPSPENIDVCPIENPRLNPFIGHWNSTYRVPLSSLIFRIYIYIYIPFFFPLLVFNLSFLHPFIRSSIRLFRRASSRSNRTWPLFRLLFPFSFLFSFFSSHGYFYWHAALIIRTYNSLPPPANGNGNLR